MEALSAVKIVASVLITRMSELVPEPISERAILKQTRPKSEAMVRHYIRDDSLFRDNAASRVGLCSPIPFYRGNS